MEASSVSPVPTGPVPTDPGVAVSSARNGAARATPQASAPTRATGSPREVLARPIELPPERRLSAATLAAIAAAAGVSAIALGGWAFFSGVRADGSAANADTAPPGYQQAISLLAKPDVDRLPLRGSVGRIILVVEPSGDATLVLNGLTAADSQWAYQAWVTPPNAPAPRPAALFSGREALVPLTAPVLPGATVSVTLEPAEGSFAPTRTAKLVVERPV